MPKKLQEFNMEPKELIEKAKKALADLTGFTNPAGVGIRKEKEGWLVTVEICEKKSIPSGMDILGTYEVRINKEGKILGYERKELRKRMDTGSFEKKE